MAHNEQTGPWGNSGRWLSTVVIMLVVIPYALLMGAAVADPQPDTNEGPRGFSQESSDLPPTGCFLDPVGDVADLVGTGEQGIKPRADIAGHCAFYYDGIISVGIVVDQASDPMTDESWTNGDTQAYWMFDVNEDGQTDYYFQYYPRKGELGAYLTDANGTEICTGVGLYTEGFYIAGLAANCMGTPALMSVAAAMVYGDQSGSGNVVSDRAPDGQGWDGPVVHQVPTSEPAPPATTGSGEVEGSIPPDELPPPEDESVLEPDPVEDPPSQTDPFDGDPSVTTRIDAADPTTAAIAISQMRFQSQAPFVVLSRDDIFADSLAGSSLTQGAPMLFTNRQTLDPATLSEIERVTETGSVVYILGGVSAVSASVEEALTTRGYVVNRLAGPSRVETAIAIADELAKIYENTGGSVMLARAYGAPNDATSGWADAISAGGIAARDGMPILLTPTENLHPSVSQWLTAHPQFDVTLLGGTAALSIGVQEALPQSLRVAGADRTATAVEIARSMWGVKDGDPARYVITAAYNSQGWGFGLAAAGLSADHAAPVLLVGDAVSDAAEELLASCGDPRVQTLLIGGTTIIGDEVRIEIDQMDGGAC